VLPGHPDTDGAIEVIFPEHVTVRRQGNREAEQLYLEAWAARRATRLATN
jgi:hypothetical protein